MVGALYEAGWAMSANLEANDVVATNLANVDTPRFRRLVPEFVNARAHTLGSTQSNLSGLAQQQSAGSIAGGLGGITVHASKAPFRLEPTGRALDLVLAPGFFLDTMSGRQTADGRLSVAPDGTLVDSAGEQVRGTGGAIKVSGALHVSINAKGQVYDDGKLVGSLSIQNPTGAIAPGGGVIRSGVLEKSNVNLTRELVTMIQINKAYEFAAKSVQAVDETLGKLKDIIRVA